MGTPSQVKTNVNYGYPHASNAAGSAVVTFYSGLDLAAEGVVAGQFFKYRGEATIYTILSVGSGTATMTANIAEAHTEAAFVIHKVKTGTLKLPLPYAGDAEWGKFLRSALLTAETAIAGATSGFQTSIAQFSDGSDATTSNKLLDNTLGNPLEILDNTGGSGGGATNFRATVTTGGSVSGAFIHVRLSFRHATFDATVNQRHRITLQQSVNAGAFTNVRTWVFPTQGASTPDTTGVYYFSKIGTARFDQDLTVFITSLTASATYTFRARLEVLVAAGSGKIHIWSSGEIGIGWLEHIRRISAVLRG